LILVSYLYFSIRSLSPENQPSSLPPDLTTLDLTLFEVGGVDSMMAETKTEKNSLNRFLQEMLQEILQEILQEMLQLVVLMEEICTRFYSRKRNQFEFNFISGYLIFRERGLDSALHRKCQEKLRITWSSHVIFN